MNRLIMFFILVLGILNLVEGNYDAALPWFILVVCIDATHNVSLMAAHWKKMYTYERIKRGR